MKMLKELKGKLVTVTWARPIRGIFVIDFRMEDYCEIKEELWIKLRRLDDKKQMTWYKFSEVQSIGRVP